MVMIFEWLFAALFWIGALMFLIGLALLISPASVLKASEPLNRWIMTDTVFHSLDRPIQLERQFYRHHILMGSLIIIGAGYCLYSLSRWFQFGALDFRAGLELSEILVEAMTYVLVLGNLLALFTGLIVLFRPSFLKGFESWSNTWVESDSVSETLNTRLDVTERWLPRFPRLLGLLTVIGSLYIMSNTVIMVLN